MYPEASIYGVNYNRQRNNPTVDTSVNPEANDQDALADENAEAAQQTGKTASIKSVGLAVALIAGLVIIFGVGGK